MEHMVHNSEVRRLWPGDLKEFREHLLRLDDVSRKDRFAMAADDGFINRYAGNCFSFDDVIYGFYVDGILRGAGELRSVGEPFGESVEAVFSVETNWRQRGVGSELMARLVRAARNRRAETLYMTYLANNVGMQALARKSDGSLSFDAGEIDGRVIARDTVRFVTSMVDLNTRMFSLCFREAQPQLAIAI